MAGNTEAAEPRASKRPLTRVGEAPRPRGRRGERGGVCVLVLVLVLALALLLALLLIPLVLVLGGKQCATSVAYKGPCKAVSRAMEAGGRPCREGMGLE